MILFDCPHCGKHFSFSDRFAGRQMICSGCKSEILVPEPETELGLAPIPDGEKTPREQAKSVAPADHEDDSTDVGLYGLADESPAAPPKMVLPEILPSSALPPLPPLSESLPPPLPPSGTPLPPPPPPLPPFAPPPTSAFDLPPIPDIAADAGFPPFPSLDSHLDLPAYTEPVAPLPPPVPETFGSEGAAPSLAAGADEAILAYVYEEKHKGEILSPGDPATLERPEAAPKPESPLRKNLIYWGSIGTVLLLVVGISLYLALFVDWSGKDSRPLTLDQITQQKNQTIIEAKNKELESELLRTRSLKSWNKTEEFIDAFVIAQGERDDKAMDIADLDASMRLHAQDQGLVQEYTRRREEAALSLQSVEERMAELRKQILAGTEEALDHEREADLASLEGTLLREAARHYEEQEKDLTAKIRDFPKSREPYSINRFDLDRNRRTLEHRTDLTKDWTEDYFSHFDFPGVSEDRFFAAFDAARLSGGLKSLRLAALERAPMTVLFPKDRKARNSLEEARFFSFVFRVPELRDPIFLGSDTEAGKIGEFRVRFGNSAGYVEFQTASPRYCEALFYEARNKFTPVEFSLEGDAFWRRNDQYDMSKFRDEDDIDILLSGAEPEDGENKEPSFFSRIDWIEIRLMPLSDRTNIWLDEIMVTQNKIRGHFDLLRTETLQDEIRRREKDYFQKRQAAQRAAKTGVSGDRTLPDGAEDIEFIDPEDDDGPMETPEPARNVSGGGNSLPIEFDGSEEQRLARLCVWVLEKAQGQIRLRSAGRQISLGPRSRIPASLESMTIEEISIAGFQNLTESQLAQIGDCHDLKRLNLSRTGLKDADINKLSALVALEALDLSGNSLTYEALLALRTLSRLEELNIEGISSNVKGLETFRSLTSLKSLNLSHSNAAIADMMYLITLEKLETLNLASTKLGDRAAKVIANLASLKNLDMTRSQITDEGVAALESLGHLETLRLSHTAVTDACLESLKKLPKLESVSALKTGITRNGVRQTLGEPLLAKFKLD